MPAVFCLQALVHVELKPSIRQNTQQRRPDAAIQPAQPLGAHGRRQHAHNALPRVYPGRRRPSAWQHARGSVRRRAALHVVR